MGNPQMKREPQMRTPIDMMPVTGRCGASEIARAYGEAR